MDIDRNALSKRPPFVRFQARDGKWPGSWGIASVQIVRESVDWPIGFGSSSLRSTTTGPQLPSTRRQPAVRFSGGGTDKWPRGSGVASVQIVRESVDWPIGFGAPTLRSSQSAPELPPVQRKASLSSRCGGGVRPPKWPECAGTASVQIIREAVEWPIGFGAATLRSSTTAPDLPSVRRQPTVRFSGGGTGKWPKAAGAASVQIVRESVDWPIGFGAPTLRSNQTQPELPPVQRKTSRSSRCGGGVRPPKWPECAGIASVQIVRESVDWPIGFGASTLRSSATGPELPSARRQTSVRFQSSPKLPAKKGIASVQVVRESVDWPIGFGAPASQSTPFGVEQPHGLSHRCR